MTLEQQNTSISTAGSNERTENNQERNWKDNLSCLRLIESLQCCLRPLGSAFSSDLLYILYTCSFILIVMGAVFLLFDSKVGVMVFGPGVFLVSLSVIGSIARWSKKGKETDRLSTLEQRPEDIMRERSQSQTSAVVNEAYVSDLPPRYSDIFPVNESRPPSYNAIPKP